MSFIKHLNNITLTLTLSIIFVKILNKNGNDIMITIAIPQMGTDLFRKYMKSKYTKSITNAGGCVRWIELNDMDAAIEQALTCDGLLLPGGPDIDPKYYYQNPIPASGTPNPLSDSVESSMIGPFLASGKPLLAICRGMQLLNIHFGGTLFQDIKEQQTYKHSDFFSRSGTTHPITIDESSHLYQILHTAQTDVDSIHHQAIDRLGERLTATAYSPDGFVEGIELPNHPFCIGVQWHPEHMSRKSAMQRKLFTAFIQACQEDLSK